MAQAPDFKMDAAGLYREEIYTDRKVGTIRVMIPVKDDGTADTARQPIYMGEAQIMTPMGALPVNFDIEAATLQDAVAGYGEAAREGIERAVKELQEMRRQAASSIVIPQGGAGLPGTPPGKIQLP